MKITRELLDKLNPDQLHSIALQISQAKGIDPKYINSFDLYQTTPLARIFHLSMAKHRKYEGGNGSSKTFGGSYDDCVYLLGRAGKSMESSWKRPIPKRPVHWRVCCVDDFAMETYII